MRDLDWIYLAQIGNSGIMKSLGTLHLTVYFLIQSYAPNCLYSISNSWSDSLKIVCVVVF